ncbi:MAG: TIR domain-containing protein [Thermoguttaceae bacterium]|nr:TIR domain-containing protein [Thermoguttaceae bacterium]
MAKQKKYDFFISYRRANGGDARAQMIRSELIKRGYRVFLDLRNLKPGEPFDEELLKRIEEAKFFIASLTPNSLDRCYQDGDWVYREIEHAFASGKTIVPVTTPDFWRSQEKPSLDGKNAVSQEKAEEIARTLDKLSRLQAIEAGPKHFDAAMDDLQGTFPLSRRRKLMVALSRKLVAFALLAALAAGTLAATAYCKYRAEQKKVDAEFAAASEEVAEAIAVEFCVISFELEYAKRVDAALRSYHDKCRRSPEKVEEYYEDFLETLVEKDPRTRAEIFSPPVKKRATPSDAAFETLRKNGMNETDVRNYFSVLPEISKHVDYYYDSMKKAAEETRNIALDVVSWDKERGENLLGDVDSLFDDPTITESINYLGLETPIKGMYLAYLELLTQMPESVYPKVRECFRYSTLFPEIQIKQSREDLQLAQQRCSNELKNAINRLQAVVDSEKKKLTEEQRDMFNVLTEDTQGALTNLIERGFDEEEAKELLDGTVSLIAKERAVEGKESELTALYGELIALYIGTLEQCKLQETDSTGLCWGKILRLARYLRGGLEQEAKGVRSPEAISTQRILGDILQRLDRFVELRGDEEKNLELFVPSAKRYFTLLAEGKIEDAGLLVIGIENDATHPNLAPGDIIWKVDGQQIHNFYEYKSLTDGKFGLEIERLRFDADGEPTFETYETVEGSPRVTFAGLAEVEEENAETDASTDTEAE